MSTVNESPPPSVPAARPRRKVRVGVVTSDKMDKTVVVTVEDLKRHPLYRKVLRRQARFAAHDETNACRVGDRVRIAETRPQSLTKRWRVVEIVERAR
ncbi:MAG TPA: 30S ribosomal protein S17 [Verrucomicrobiae bacterium]|nr:30S ribosomal protein S17 [Verrucomicrobiae bacterium]